MINGHRIAIGNTRLIPEAASLSAAVELQQQGKTPLYITQDGKLVGVLAAVDTIRSEVSEALAAVRGLGVKKIELLTGDNERVAAALAKDLGVDYQANLLPEDKIAIVKAYQQQGYKVMMVGDGVNDAPALAQADIGVAMGVAGTDVAIEAAHVTLMRDDWLLVPEVLAIAKRTMRVVKTNLIFTVVYNLIGLTLAAFGILPPILAAAAQSLPDLGILANSSRLLHHRARFIREEKPIQTQSQALELEVPEVISIEQRTKRLQWMYLAIVGLVIVVVLALVGQNALVSNAVIDANLKRFAQSFIAIGLLLAFVGGHFPDPYDSV